MKKLLIPLALLLGTALACHHTTRVYLNPVKQAHCVLYPTKGNNVTGIVTFTQMKGFVKVHAEVHGLTPGKHGFHIHEKGDCSSGDGKSAGGHFNPTGVEHAGPHAEARHIGDLGNLVADENGRAVYEAEDSVLAMAGPHTIIGRGLIVHEKPDDLKSQPTGAAGARVACGVIGVIE